TPLRGQHYAYRLEDDEQVYRQRTVLQIVEVIGKLFFGGFHGGAMVRMRVVFYLCPTGKSRCHEITRVVVRDARGVLVGKRRELWPRTHERKIAFHHCPELRELVYAQESKPLADTRDFEF